MATKELVIRWGFHHNPINSGWVLVGRVLVERGEVNDHGWELVAKDEVNDLGWVLVNMDEVDGFMHVPGPEDGSSSELPKGRS